MARSLKLRWYVFALVGSITIPLLTLVAWSLWNGTYQQTRTANAMVQALAGSVARNASQFLKDNEHVLTTLGSRPDVIALNPADCPPELSATTELFPSLTSIYTVNENGVIVCSSLGTSGRVLSSNWYADVIATGLPYVGEPQLGQITGRWTVVHALPITNAGGERVGVVAATIDLVRYQDALNTLDLPADSVVGILNRQGVVVARFPDAASFVGRNMSDQGQTAAILAVGEGNVNGPGFDGIDRLHGVSPIDSSRWVAYVGVPTAAIHADANAANRRFVVAGTLLALLGIVFTILLIRGITGPIDALARTVRDADNDPNYEPTIDETGPAEIVVAARSIARSITRRRLARIALVTSEKRYRDLVEHSSGFICTHALDGVVLSINQAAADALGYRPSDITGRNLADFLDPSTVEQFSAYLRRFDGESKVSGLMRLLTRSGEVRIWSFQNRLLTSEGVPHVLGTAIDITEWRRVQEQLRESEERHRSVVSVLNEGVLLQAADGSIVAANSAAERILGITPDDLGRVGAEFPGRIREDGTPFPIEEYPSRVTLRTGKPQTNVVLGLQGESETTWISANSQPLIRAGDSSPHAVVLSFSDITEQRNTLLALRASEKRFAQIFRMSPIAISMSSVGEGRYLEVNDSWLRLFDFDREAVIGRTSSELNLFDNPTSRAAAVAKLREETSLTGFIVSHRTRTGEYRQVLSALTLMEYNGEDSILAILHDVTEQQAAEEALRLSEERAQKLSIVASRTDNAVIIADPSGAIEWVNDAFSALTGHRLDEVVGRDPAFLFGPDTDREVVATAQANLLSRHDFDVEVLMYTKAGQPFWAEFDVQPVRDDAGTVVNHVGLITDITERRRNEAALQDANVQLRAWVAELEQRNRDISLFSELGEHLQTCQTQQEAFALIGRLVPRFFGGLGGAVLALDPAIRLLETVTSWGDVPAGIVTPDDCWSLRRGREHAVDAVSAGMYCAHSAKSGATLCVPLMAQGQALGVLHLWSTDGAIPAASQQLASTIGEQIALALSNLTMRETLRIQSTRDPLTGLFNRRYLHETLARELHRAVRTDRTVAVLMLDIDHFKQFNDRHGHPAGDTLLREVGNLLTNNIRGGDMACRYGGEEFTLVLPEAGLEVAEQRAESIRRAISALQVVHEGRVLGSITASIGVAMAPVSGTSADTLLQAADAALYRAKANGRDQVVTAVDIEPAFA